MFKTQTTYYAEFCDYFFHFLNPKATLCSAECLWVKWRKAERACLTLYLPVHFQLKISLLNLSSSTHQDPFIFSALSTGVGGGEEQTKESNFYMGGGETREQKS